jgi:small-conductance mechanosensitive channel
LWRQRDNAELVVPNQTFFTTTTTTYTGTDAMRRGEVVVSAAYRHDPEQVMRILLDAARSVAKVLRHPPPSAFIAAYSSSSIDYSVRYFIADPLENLSVRTAVSEAVWKSFAASGIEIPFPQRVLHQAPDRG